MSAFQIVGSDVREKWFAVQWQVVISLITYNVYFSSKKERCYEITYCSYEATVASGGLGMIT